MVVQYISCVSYGSEFLFRLPRRALDNSVRGYEIFEGEGLVRCFYCDSRKELGINQWAVPDGAKEMEFAEMDFHGEKRVGWPIYYNEKGEVLKEGNH